MNLGSTFPVNFYIEEVQETSVKVSLMDTSDCAHLASYKMSVNGSEEIAIVDGVVSGGRFSLKSCAEAEFVITRYIGGVLNGEASSLTSLTYGGELEVRMGSPFGLFILRTRICDVGSVIHPVHYRVVNF